MPPKKGTGIALQWFMGLMAFIWVASLIWLVLSGVFCLAICAAARRESPESRFARNVLHVDFQETSPPTGQGQSPGTDLGVPNTDPHIPRSAQLG